MQASSGGASPAGSPAGARKQSAAAGPKKAATAKDEFGRGLDREPAAGDAADNAGDPEFPGPTADQQDPDETYDGFGDDDLSAAPPPSGGSAPQGKVSPQAAHYAGAMLSVTFSRPVLWARAVVVYMAHPTLAGRGAF